MEIFYFIYKKYFLNKMKIYELGNPEEFLLAKMEWDKIHEEIAEKENRKYEKVKFEEFPSQLGLNKNVWVKQIQDEVHPIPYAEFEFNNEKYVYCIILDDKLEKDFKYFINNKHKFYLKEYHTEEAYDNPLDNRCYIIRNNKIFYWD